MAFVALANLIDLHDGYCKVFNCGGRSILLIQDDGRHYAIENSCPHMQAPLAGGQVLDGSITCRAHGISFRLQSGVAEGPLAATLSCLNRFEVAYDGNKVGVDF